MSAKFIPLLGFNFFGIEIDFLKSINRGVFLHTIASSNQSTEHCCRAVQLDLALLAFDFDPDPDPDFDLDDPN